MFVVLATLVGLAPCASASELSLIALAAAEAARPGLVAAGPAQRSPVVGRIVLLVALVAAACGAPSSAPPASAAVTDRPTTAPGSAVPGSTPNW